MTDEQIQELVLAFLDRRGGYVAGASERELFLMVKGAVLLERERCATQAENFIPSGFAGAFGVARDDRARAIAYRIRHG